MSVLFCLVFVIFNFFRCMCTQKYVIQHQGSRKCWAWPPGSTCCKGSPGRRMAGQPFSHFFAQRRGFVVSCWIGAVNFYFCSEEQSVPISLTKKFLCLCKIPARKPFPVFLWEARYRMSSQWINQPWTDRVNRGKENFASRPWCHRINTYKRKTFFPFPRNDTFL